VGFEPKILAFERARTVYALGRATTVIGITILSHLINYENGVFCIWWILRIGLRLLIKGLNITDNLYKNYATMEEYY
jgi:hypothetical protein